MAAGLGTAQIEAILAGDREARGFEVKTAGTRDDKRLFAKVAHAALGLGNLRDGGSVVVGIDDDRLAAMEPGMSDEQLATWTPDDVGRKLRDWADPPLRVDVYHHTLGNGRRVVEVFVHPFDLQPHLSARDYDDVVEKGRLYIRSLSHPETTAVASGAELRELLDIAAERRLAQLLATVRNAGATLELGPGDEDRYAAQRSDAFK